MVHGLWLMVWQGGQGNGRGMVRRWVIWWRGLGIDISERAQSARCLGHVNIHGTGAPGEEAGPFCGHNQHPSLPTVGIAQGAHKVPMVGMKGRKLCIDSTKWFSLAKAALPIAITECPNFQQPLSSTVTQRCQPASSWQVDYIGLFPQCKGQHFALTGMGTCSSCLSCLHCFYLHYHWTYRMSYLLPWYSKEHYFQWRNSCHSKWSCSSGPILMKFHSLIVSPNILEYLARWSSGRAFWRLSYGGS